ncbi:MAG: hypothetical protein R3200_16970 [Xanthomonadales bacterium]|nr:hypothetical protein [Xanthomonadales bacterium]
MNRPSATLTLCGALLITSGCVIDARERDTLIEPVRNVEIVVPADATIFVRVPAGDVDITNSPDDLLRGQMRIMCPDRESRCAKRLGDLEFTTETSADEVRVALSRDGMWQFRHGNVEVDLQVPSEHTLNLDMSAGDVNVEVANCLAADIEAGDASFSVPLDRVRSVDLDTGVGDAALSVDGDWRAGRRSMLVGAEVHWHEGPGECEMMVDLQAGDLRVDLVDGLPDAELETAKSAQSE